MHFAILPTRTAGAAENMAADFLLLQRYPEPRLPRFRHYEWFAPAFTFGYAQKIAFVRPQLPPGERFDLCRRPTGGGIVDHREDWTYSLVIPRGHALEEQRAAQSYRIIHDALADALRAQGVRAGLKLFADESADAAGICFQRAEIFDVVDEASGN
jgi:lipoyl(octanoyl) transferase